jgi:mono/diheme cytochrome c family protein
MVEARVKAYLTVLLSVGVLHGYALAFPVTFVEEPAADDVETARSVVEGSCWACHNDSALVGNMSLDGFDVASPETDAALAEKMIRKLRYSSSGGGGSRHAG